jgi:hypothetical protein
MDQWLCQTRNIIGTIRTVVTNMTITTAVPVHRKHVKTVNADSSKIFFVLKKWGISKIY